MIRCKGSSNVLVILYDIQKANQKAIARNLKSLCHLISDVILCRRNNTICNVITSLFTCLLFGDSNSNYFYL